MRVILANSVNLWHSSPWWRTCFVYSIVSVVLIIFSGGSGSSKNLAPLSNSTPVGSYGAGSPTTPATINPATGQLVSPGSQQSSVVVPSPPVIPTHSQPKVHQIAPSDSDDGAVIEENIIVEKPDDFGTFHELEKKYVE